MKVFAKSAFAAFFAAAAVVMAVAADIDEGGTDRPQAAEGKESKAAVEAGAPDTAEKKQAGQNKAEADGKKAEAKAAAAQATDSAAPKQAEAGSVKTEAHAYKISSFADPRDNKRYRSARIGNKTWMAENLNYKTANSHCYNSDSSNCDKYGRLYNLNEAKTACPAGWHLPTRAEWHELVQASGGRQAAKKLKSKIGWNKNGNGTDDFVFSALPGGFRRNDGNFYDAGWYGYWWSATEGGGLTGYTRYINYNLDIMYDKYDDRKHGLSVRCVQD